MPASVPDPVKCDHPTDVQWSAAGIGIIRRGDSYAYYLTLPDGSGAIGKRVCEALDGIVNELQRGD